MVEVAGEVTDESVSLVAIADVGEFPVEAVGETANEVDSTIEFFHAAVVGKGFNAALEIASKIKVAGKVEGEAEVVIDG
jgi:hypothetical protein